MRREDMRNKIFAVLSILMVVSMLLAACATPAAPTEAPKTEEPAAEEPKAEEPKAAEPTKAPEEPAATDKVQIRWFVGLGTGTDPAQQEIQQQVVDEFAYR
jgi:multiple sugar transport system substrate-binding protein